MLRRATLKQLREAGLVEIWKGFEGRRPQTLCRLTPEGRRRFVEYLEELEKVVKEWIRLMDGKQP